MYCVGLAYGMHNIIRCSLFEWLSLELLVFWRLGKVDIFTQTCVVVRFIGILQHPSLYRATMFIYFSSSAVNCNNDISVVWYVIFSEYCVRRAFKIFAMPLHDDAEYQFFYLPIQLPPHASLILLPVSARNHLHTSLHGLQVPFLAVFLSCLDAMR